MYWIDAVAQRTHFREGHWTSIGLDRLRLGTSARVQSNKTWLQTPGMDYPKCLMKAMKAVTCWKVFLPLEQLDAIGLILPSRRSSWTCAATFLLTNQVHRYALTSGIAEEQPAILSLKAAACSLNTASQRWFHLTDSQGTLSTSHCYSTHAGRSRSRSSLFIQAFPSTNQLP